MSGNILIYGASGYTGKLTVAEAIARGGKPILAGRSEEKIQPLAKKYNLEFRIFSLDQSEKIDQSIEDISVVLNCAGPFSKTARPLARACIRTHTHYLDITGEITTFRALLKLSAEASKANVMLLPGCGFDVVPTDCLAAHLKKRLPSAKELTLAIQLKGLSRGTLLTFTEHLDRGTVRCKEGRYTFVPLGSRLRTFDFGKGPVKCLSISWGDLCTAHYSTGIPTIEVFMPLPPALKHVPYLVRIFGWFLRFKFVKKSIKKRVLKAPLGPTEEERATIRGQILGEVKDASGTVLQTCLTTPDGYTLTAQTAWKLAALAAEGHTQPGFHTPAQLHGADFILQFDAIERFDR